ncbi:unnamed protein product [Ectocarpus sp. CCAP 1310/34]|nr:unnamed protein product [Ectocarpus sp. CCAP 1310/34]
MPPLLKHRQLTDECGNAVTDGFSETVTYDGDSIEDGDRLQMDMYICAPWGNYELELVSKSTNGGNAMEKIAWEVEYGPDEYHIWDTLNTPFFDDSLDYAPIPSGSGEEETFTFPLEGSEGYYSVMYSGPFPPLECSNLHPSGITYEGCYSAGIFGTADGPTGSANDADPAENYRMFDGIDDDGVNADKVMTLEKCAATCTAQGTQYFGLESAVKCLCGDELVGSPTDDVYGDGGSVCGIDITFGGDVPEYKYLCSGDSRVLCGTDDHISVYSLDGSTGGGDDDSGDPPVGSELIGCVADSQDDRDGYTELHVRRIATALQVNPAGSRASPFFDSQVMSEGPMSAATMSAEVGAIPFQVNFLVSLTKALLFFPLRMLPSSSPKSRLVQCWCTGSLGTTETSTACTYPCAGNAGETCGGFDALTLYEIISEAPPTPAPLTPPGPTPAPASPVVPSGDYDFVDCVADSQSPRVRQRGEINGGWRFCGW